MRVLVESLSDLKERMGENCDDSGSIYSVSEFEVDPNPPKRNNKLSLTMIGTLTRDETVASIDLFLDFNQVNLDQESFPERGSHSAGSSVEYKLSMFFPDIAPVGNYDAYVKVKNTAGAYLSCWKYSFSL